MAIVTCRTDGCANAGHGIDVEMSFTDDDGEAHDADAVVCGVCGQPITDIA